MGPLAENAIEVPLISRPYHLAVLKGRENIVAPLRVALDRLKNSGEFDRLVEQYLSSPVRTSWLERYAFMLSLAGGLVLLLVAGGTVWNRSLHRQVQARTKAVERTERRYRDLVDNASDMIYRNRSVRAVHVRQSGRDAHSRLRRGRIVVDEVLRADAARLGAAGDGLLREGGEDARVDLSRVPGPQEGRQRDLGRAARAPDHHGGRIEGFQGMARDITDRVNAQSSCAPSATSCRRFSIRRPSLIMVLDAHGHIVRFNRACEDLSGVTMSDVAGPAVLGCPVLLDDDSRGDSLTASRGSRRRPSR
jgi:PAS domain-containing protein